MIVRECGALIRAPSVSDGFVARLRGNPALTLGALIGPSLGRDKDDLCPSLWALTRAYTIPAPKSSSFCDEGAGPSGGETSGSDGCGAEDPDAACCASSRSAGPPSRSG